MATTQAPVLSTPSENLFEQAIPRTVADQERLSNEQLYVQYEIRRTVREIREGRWKRIALQFPDGMLVDAPRVVDQLSGLLREKRRVAKPSNRTIQEENLQQSTLSQSDNDHAGTNFDDLEEKLTILADTSYGACCVDEVAAEHVDAEVVVHYGRACLSPTARLPVLYVFTSRDLDLDAAVASFKATYPQRSEKVCLMADIPFSRHVSEVAKRLREEQYENLFATDVVRDPLSLLPNRTLPTEVIENPASMKEYSIFHISEPPTSLLLALSSRVKSIHIFPTDSLPPSESLQEASTSALMRRRYATLTKASTVPIFGILINTLSVSNYMSALQHCQELIATAGKKSYVFVVGKVNTAKLANFSEIGAWVVIGCWESSLIESKEFFAPLITPFELDVALQGDAGRQWGGNWIANFEELLENVRVGERNGEAEQVSEQNGVGSGVNEPAASWDDQLSDDEPPEFDLRTGRYVSRTRPMGRVRPVPAASLPENGATLTATIAPPSSELVQRPKAELATINGAVSPAAEFLRSKRTWQGLGSDYEVVYERDKSGKIRGAAMEEGRAGVAKGYAVGSDEKS